MVGPHVLCSICCLRMVRTQILITIQIKRKFQGLLFQWSHNQFGEQRNFHWSTGRWCSRGVVHLWSKIQGIIQGTSIEFNAKNPNELSNQYVMCSTPATMVSWKLQCQRHVIGLNIFIPKIMRKFTHRIAMTIRILLDRPFL